MLFFRISFTVSHIHVILFSADHVRNEKERYVPFSAPPFREGDDQDEKQADRDRLVKAANQGATDAVMAAKADGVPERHPEWLELVCPGGHS